MGCWVCLLRYFELFCSQSQSREWGATYLNPPKEFAFLLLLTHLEQEWQWKSKVGTSTQNNLMLDFCPLNVQLFLPAVIIHF